MCLTLSLSRLNPEVVHGKQLALVDLSNLAHEQPSCFLQRNIQKGDKNDLVTESGRFFKQNIYL